MRATELPFEVEGGIGGAEQIEEVVPRLGSLVAMVEPTAMAMSTPCARWTVRDLLNHVVGGATMFAEAFGGAPVRDISGRLPDLVGDDPSAAFDEAVSAFGRAAQQQGAMERVLVLPVGPMTGHTFLRFASFDLLVHSWDLATALRTPFVAPDDELVLEMERFTHQVLDGQPRDDRGFGAEVAVPDDADPLERLLAYTGRQP